MELRVLLCYVYYYLHFVLEGMIIIFNIFLNGLKKNKDELKTHFIYRYIVVINEEKYDLESVKSFFVSGAAKEVDFGSEPYVI